MKNLKRIFAWIGIIVLLGLYVVTFILGITGNASSKGMLMAAIACTVVVPCLMYVMLLLARILGGKHDAKQDSDSTFPSEDERNRK